MDSYVVRIYRRDGLNPEKLVGLVEKVGREETRAFHTVAELGEILSEPFYVERAVTPPIFKVIAPGKKNSR